MAISKKKKEAALTWVKDVNSDLDNLSSRLRSKWYDWWNLYRTFEIEEQMPGQSRVFIPKIYEIIEKKVPQIVQSDPKFILTPRVNAASQYIGPLRDAIGFWWDEDQMQMKLEKLVKDSFIFGIGLVKLDWHQDMKPVTTLEYDVDEETGDTVEVEVTEDEVVFERPTAELVSIFDLKADPRVESPQDGVGIIHFIHDLRLADLERMGDMFDLSDIKGLNPEQLESDEYTSSEAQEQADDLGIDQDAQNIDRNKITLAEYWGMFSPTGKAKDEVEYVITTVVVDNEPAYVIRCEKNELGFRPFVKMDDRVIRGEFYAIGEVEPLEGLQIEYNNLRNARIDFNNAINYPEWIYNSNAGINPASLVHRPNNLIPVDLPLNSDISSVIRPVDKPSQPVSGYNEESQMNRDFQSISQSIDFTDRGGSQGFTNTATGVASRDKQIGQQAQNVLRHLEASISEIGKMWLGLAEAFSEDEISIRRKRTEEEVSPTDPSLAEVPEKFTTISKDILEDALFNFEVKVEAGSTTADTAEGKAQDAINIANTAAQFASLGVPINLEKVFKDILADSFQKVNVEEYIKAPEPQMPGMEQMGGNPMPSNPAQPGGKVPLQPSQPQQQVNI